MKHDYLKWGALVAALVATASAEYELARAVGFNQYVAAAVPAALDLYTVRALRAHKEVLAAVAAMIGVNAASHLVTTGLLPVNVWLVVAVAAIAPLVLWRVHSLGAGPEESSDRSDIATVAVPEVTAPVTVERADGDQPRALPESHGVVPAGVRLLSIVARPAPAPEPSPYRWDHIRGRLVDDQEQTLFEVPDLVTTSSDERSPDPDSEENVTRSPVAEPVGAVTTSVGADTPRQVVTEVITLTPSELRRRASKLNRELVTSTNRTVTIDQLRAEFGLTRREAAELRRLVVTPEGGERS
ncbi:hypothetical protein RB628_03600 [Streptomyces sp. ADMS]|uniref:hypothetical protein n=1 Tax=Streptomyces sp. ADMS TaxID=3071415 RepID=UPI00296E7498|nr:hypothetical protein [Streptomyces sp. ADMS]MDW4904445.1 hypothetical protein [Streptomyces sp. ADMS]